MVASRKPKHGRGMSRRSQSPSLRGSGRFPARRNAPVSIDESQSPSLRGSGRFLVWPPYAEGMAAGLNPLHCGAVVASIAPRRMAEGQGGDVSIPFIAGQWSLPFRPWKRSEPSGSSLNPLHCGAVVASRLNNQIEALARLVSIPFIAGQWSLRHARRMAGVAGRRSLNPLHCGAVVASSIAGIAFCNAPTVSIPFIAGQWSLQALARNRAQEAKVSIPFIAGQWSLHCMKA